MRSNTFKYSLLTAAVAASLGITSAANAATATAGDNIPKISNVATATYFVGTAKQNDVQSNTVVVNITQSAAFSLTAKDQDTNLTDDYNLDRVVTPKGRVSFTHRLQNSGNLDDTYTLQLTNGGTISEPNHTQGVGSYDLNNTNVTYVIHNEDDSIKSTTTVTGTAFQNTEITLKPGEYAEILISAKTTGNVGGVQQNLTLSATSEFFTAATNPQATLTNVNNSTTKVPVFKITSKVSGTLDLNNPSSTVTYTVKVRNDESAPYAVTANQIVVFDGLPAGLKLAAAPNLQVSNGASIVAGAEGEGASSAQDSIRVTLLNLKPGEEATITFDVQKDADEVLASPKDTINHAHVTLDLGEGNIIYDSTNSDDANQNTSEFYPAGHDSEATDGTVNNNIGSDSTAPLVANKRALSISDATSKEIPTTTTGDTQITHSVVISNTGRETEGDTLGEIKFTITDSNNVKISHLPATVEVVYDADNNPNTANVVYTVTKDGNGDYDLSTAVPKNGGPVWSGMQPNSTITINYDVKSDKADIGTVDQTTVTMVVGGVDAPTVANPTVQNTTSVKGLQLVKSQALNATCSANVTLTFTTGEIAAEPGECIVYKITAFNNFTETDPLVVDQYFKFKDVLISDAVSQFANKAVIQNSSTAYAFEVKLDDVASATASPASNTYNATVGTTAVSGTVTELAPQRYAAMVFAVKINTEGFTPVDPSSGL